MKVTFIEHSGFSVEMSETVLLFDYYKGTIPKFPTDKRIFVFASHGHGDHYNPEIWKLKDRYPDITYILSDDIQTKEDAVMMGPHEKKEIRGIHSETLKSNDMGVAFLVQAEGKTIYHAGDLNWWHWNGEPDEDNEYYKKTFQEEIRRLEGTKIDVAFMLLDPRQEDKYCWGMNYFLEKVHPRRVFPMHCFGSYKITKHYLGCSDGKHWRDVVYEITGPSEEFIIEDEG